MSKRPGPKPRDGKKKKTHSFTLSDNAIEQLFKLAYLNNSSMSFWIEQKIKKESEK